MRKKLSSNAIRLLFIIIFLLPGKTVSKANEPQAEQELLNFHDILRDSLLFHAEISISSPNNNSILWKSQIDKITVPGREVDVLLEGKEGRLKVIFTIFPAKGSQLLLVARNETRYEGQYHSAITMFSMNFQDEVLYYPLGRTEDAKQAQPVEISMKLRISPYLETLDETSRRNLESVLDSSTRFNLTGKDR